MLVYILKRKSVRGTLLSIEADGNPLYHAYIVHGAFLVKIGQGDMSVFLIYINRFDRGWNLLDQSQPAVPVFFVGVIDKILQSRPSKPSGIPGSHLYIPPSPSASKTRANSSGNGAVHSG